MRQRMELQRRQSPDPDTSLSDPGDEDETSTSEESSTSSSESSTSPSSTSSSTSESESSSPSSTSESSTIDSSTSTTEEESSTSSEEESSSSSSSSTEESSEESSSSSTSSDRSTSVIVTTVSSSDTTSVLSTTSVSGDKDNNDGDSGLSGSAKSGVIAACSVVGGLIAIGLILWLIMRHRKSKKSDYSPDQDEIRWPEASEPADLFPAAATRTGGHGLGRDNSMRSMASRSEGFGAVESSHRPYSDQSFGGHGQQQFMSDNGHGMMSYADHSSYDPQTPNAAGVGAGGFAAPAGAAGAMPYHPGGGTSEYHYPPGSSSENGFFNYQGAGAGQQPQQYEAPRHMSYYGSESHADMHGVGSGGEYADYADYQTAYGGSNSADGLAPHGQEHEGRQERLANPYDGLDDDTGSVRNSHSGGGRLGVVNL